MNITYKKEVTSQRIVKRNAGININYNVDARELALCIYAQIKNLI